MDKVPLWPGFMFAGIFWFVWQVGRAYGRSEALEEIGTSARVNERRLADIVRDGGGKVVMLKRAG